MSRARALAIATVLGVALLSAPAGARTTDARAPYSGPGPFAAGVTTIDLGDRKVELWYPADRKTTRGRSRDSYFIRESIPAALQAIIPPDVNPPFEQDAFRDVAPSKNGPFPLVLFAHGFASYRLQSTFLTSHLAQWGFVVASADFLERGLGSVLGQAPRNPKTDAEVFREVITRVRRESSRRNSRLAGTVRRGDIALIGHSAGGFAALANAGGRNVATYIPLSAGGRRRGGDAVVAPDTPSLYALGGDDRVIQTAGVVQFWENEAKVPKRLVVIEGAGHTSPTDTCDIGNGGLVATARANGLALPDAFDALYDCAKSVAAHDTWPVYDHFVTAQLRWAFGIDDEPVGLDRRAASSFAPLRVTYRQVLDSSQSRPRRP